MIMFQVVSLHDSVAALREKLDQCQQIRAELVTARWAVTYEDDNIDTY